VTALRPARRRRIGRASTACSKATLYNWKTKYGMNVFEAKQLTQLEDTLIGYEPQRDLRSLDKNALSIAGIKH